MAKEAPARSGLTIGIKYVIASCVVAIIPIALEMKKNMTFKNILLTSVFLISRGHVR